jgi:ABC-type multidrug transport system ATPase subunit
VGILHHGKLIAEDRPSELIRAAGVEPRLELRLSGDVEAAKRALGEDAPWSGEPDDDGRAEVAVRAPDGWRSAQDVTERLAREGVTVEESRLRDATLEDAFIKLTGSRLEGPFESV